MSVHSLRNSIAVFMILTTAACGGDGSFIASTPNPTPTPTPTPAPGPAIPAAIQTSSPTSPVAGTTKFSTLTQNTDFPMLMTAAKGGPGDGDTTTTNAGGVITAKPGGTFNLTINNAAVGINNQPMTIQNAPMIGNLQLLSDVEVGNLDYTRFGDWFTTDGVDGVFNLSAWTIGFVTPAAQIPAAGTATYTGQATGLYNAPTGGSVDFDSGFRGNVALTANFGALTLSGSITKIVASDGLNKGPVNDIGFSASIDRTNNLFAGTTSVASQVTGTYAFGPTASGLINGRFYGPNAAEVGAVFNLSEGTRRLIGSFGAKQ